MNNTNLSNFSTFDAALIDAFILCFAVSAITRGVRGFFPDDPAELYVADGWSGLLAVVSFWQLYRYKNREGMFSNYTGVLSFSVCYQNQILRQYCGVNLKIKYKKPGGGFLKTHKCIKILKSHSI
jgi:hypothetical protein